MIKLPTVSGSMMRRLLSTILLGVMATPFLAGCQEKDKPKPGSLIPNYARRDGFGCVQGVIINGFTGQRFDLSSLQEPDGIYVLIRGQKLRAQYHRDDPNLKGEYYICDIPVENEYPVFANITGYLPFESSFIIESTRSIRYTGNPGNVSTDVPIPDPILLGNIRLYPKEAGTRSLVINVRETDQPVADAMVDLQPIAVDSQFSFNGTFVNSLGARMVPTRKTTGADGVATFAASEIAYGSRYKLIVSSPASADLGQSTRTFSLGFDGALSSDRNNWEFNINLADKNEDATVVACSASPKSWNENGTITMVLNRPVQLSAGSDQKDSWIAALSGGAAVLKTNTAANNASEHVNVSISGDGKIITLALKDDAFTTAKKTPDYTKLKTDPQNTDVDLSVTYTITGVKLDVLDTDATGFNNIALSNITGANFCTATRFFQEYK